MAQETQSKNSDYILDNDEESGRLTEQHYVIKDAMGGLTMPPIDLSSGPKRILDSGTADGVWLRDLASSLPPHKYTFIGTDITGRYPKNPPAGMSFQNQNINEPWPEDWKNSFDFVHQRLTLAGAGAGTKEAITHLLELVKPGGWIELIESEYIAGKDDGPAMQQFVNLLVQVFKITGSGTSFAKNLSTWVEASGFENVQDRIFDFYLGASNPDPKLAKQGTGSTRVAVTGLVGYAKVLPIPKDEFPLGALDTLVERLDAELTERGGNFPFRVVWGRKPEA